MYFIIFTKRAICKAKKNRFWEGSKALVTHHSLSSACSWIPEQSVPKCRGEDLKSKLIHEFEKGIVCVIVGIGMIMFGDVLNCFHIERKYIHCVIVLFSQFFICKLLILEITKHFCHNLWFLSNQYFLESILAVFHHPLWSSNGNVDHLPYSRYMGWGIRRWRSSQL